MAVLQQQLSESDIVLTEAHVPGERAPKVVTGALMHAMRPGSVAVDLAVDSGGNIEATVPDDVVVTDLGVTCAGYGSAHRMASAQASSIYSSVYSSTLAEFLLSAGDSAGA